uniref:Uncharacterized protein n=1 Tax=Anguilla anguilla TaxID=7936 RepID=A0A0E9UJ83_ANGAN
MPKPHVRYCPLTELCASLATGSGVREASWQLHVFRREKLQLSTLSRIGSEGTVH